MGITGELKEEAEAFDQRIRDRIAHGMVPDLRRAERVEWFVNNPWRHPRYVEMVFGHYLRFARRHLPPAPARVLEVGCGPGHMCLELARDGYRVTGLEISNASIEIAERVAAENPFRDRFGSLAYVQSDFLSFTDDEQFDAICFFLTLHHFADVPAVLSHACRLLGPGGRLIVVEPARDWFSTTNAAFAALLRLALSAAGAWHERLELPQSAGEVGRFVDRVLREYQEARDPAEGEQSPHDNDCAAEDMLRALEGPFEQLALEPANAILPRVVGGLRAEDEESTLRLAEFVRAFDEYALRRGILQPGAFCYAGKKR